MIDSSTPRPCRKCGTTFSVKACPACKKRLASEWYEANKAKVLAANNLWNTENKKRVSELSAARYFAKKVEKKAHNAAYYLANSDAINARGRRYFKANPEVFRTSRNNRRARLLSAKGKVSSDLAKRLYAKQRGLCACCGLALGNEYHLDHIMPLALGGSNTDDNIQLLRPKCNMQKSAKHPVDFMQSRGFLL